MGSGRQWQPFGSLSAKVRLLVLLSVFPAIAVVLHQAQTNRDSATASARDLALATTRASAATQQQLMDNSRRFLQRLAQSPQARLPADPQCSRWLAEVLSLNLTYVNLGLPQADGELLCNALPLKNPVQVADRPYFQRAIGERTFSIGKFQLDRATGVSSVNFAYPVVDAGNGKVVAVVVAVLSLDWWSKNLAGSAFPAGAVARITDQDGKVVARYPQATGELGIPLATLGLPALQKEVQIWRDASGARQLTVSMPLLVAPEKSGAFMSMTVPLEALYSEANRQMWRDVGFLLAGLLLSLVLARIGVQRIVTRPLDQLLDATDRLSAQTFTHAIPVAGSSELAELARRFNVMARARQAVEQQLRLSEESLAITLYSIGDAVIATDVEGRITRMNSTAERLTGWPLSEATGRPLPEVFRIINSQSRQPVVDPAQRVMELGQVVGLANHTSLLARDGSEYHIADSAAPIRNPSGQIVGVVLVFSDVSDKYRAEQALQESEARNRNLAYFDSLTGLPNRRLLMDRLCQTLASCDRHQCKGALLFVDLDNFKVTNDTLGHLQGDLLLEQVACRLSVCVREGDTVARLGGDEFVVMLGDLSEDVIEAAAEAETVGKKILLSLNRTYQLGSHECRSSASIGIALLGVTRESADDLLRRADLAMYQAKAGGRNILCFFDPQMQTVVEARAAMETALRLAIEQGQFVLHYQPQVLDAGAVTGAEALVRWQHPQRGLVAPVEFIPLAEETGLILPLGKWVLDTACKQLAAWSRQPAMAHLTLAVNVSVHQFRQPDFVAEVLALLRDNGANPLRLKLELTESLLVSNVTDMIDKMALLKASGVRFALDDFGTGYSSLAYLKRLPLDQLKIDQSFVHDVLGNANDVAIIKTIIALARNLGLSVIAEGVETETQRAFLAGSGCHVYQGFFFSRPLTPARFEEFVLHAPAAA